MNETPPDRPTLARLEKLIAFANDDRGDPHDVARGETESSPCTPSFIPAWCE